MQYPSQHRFIERLKQNGFSITKARQRIFELLEQNGPLEPAEIISGVSPHVDRASVYRTIGLFERLRIIDRIQMGWKYKLELSDDFSDHHHHVTCLKCGTICALSADMRLEQLIRAIARRHQFKLISHQMELTGLCHNCQKHETPDA